MDGKRLGELRQALFELGDAGDAAGQHFAKLIDQRRGRRVNEISVELEADQAPLALGDADEIERVGVLDPRTRGPDGASSLRRWPAVPRKPGHPRP